MSKRSEDGKRKAEAQNHPPASEPRPPSASGATFVVKVLVRASRSAIDGWQAETLKVRLQAPPVDGRANAALIALLAEALHVGKGQVEIVGGQTARTKRVRVYGLTVDQVKTRLNCADDKVTS